MNSISPVPKMIALPIDLLEDLNLQKLTIRASFCCTKILKKLHLFLTKVAVKSCF